MKTPIAKMLFAAIAATTLLLTAINEVQAQNRFLPFASRNSNPGNNVGGQGNGSVQELNESAGPWMVMCASFIGETARVDAERLASELQQQGLRAYTYQKKFELPETVDGIFYSENRDDVMQTADGQLIPMKQKMKMARGSEFENFAVLVGDFPDINDARAQQTLGKIKKMQVRSLNSTAHEELTMQSSAGRMQGASATRLARNREASSDGIMGGAFLIPNPVLPDEYFASQSVDPKLAEQNRQYRFTLLDNPAKYTVRVATFKGVSTFNGAATFSSSTGNFGSGSAGSVPDDGSKLVEATLKASVLAKTLRDDGIEAWEFHDFSESYVCIGSFDWVSRTDSGGSTTYNPAVVNLINEYASNRTSGTFEGQLHQPRNYPRLTQLGIGFDLEPKAIPVPKAPARRGLGRR